MSRLAHSALADMFSMSGGRIHRCQDTLEQLIALTRQGVFYGWRAFAETLKINHLTQNDPYDIKRQARYYAAHCLETDRHNSLSLSLLAQVNVAIFNDLEAAGMMLTRSKSGRSDHVMT